MSTIEFVWIAICVMIIFFALFMQKPLVEHLEVASDQAVKIKGIKVKGDIVISGQMSSDVGVQKEN
jgi:hypothetical protein